MQNTLGDHHFVDDGTELTAAGKLKVAAIINQTPLSYRAIFVLRDENAETTAGRIVSIQEAVAVVLGDRPPVPIFETYDKPRERRLITSTRSRDAIRPRSPTRACPKMTAVARCPRASVAAAAAAVVVAAIS